MGHQTTVDQGGREGPMPIMSPSQPKSSTTKKQSNCHMGTSNKTTCSYGAEISIMSQGFANLTQRKQKFHIFKTVASQPSLYHHQQQTLPSSKQKWPIKPKINQGCRQGRANGRRIESSLIDNQNHQNRTNNQTTL